MVSNHSLLLYQQQSTVLKLLIQQTAQEIQQMYKVSFSNMMTQNQEFLKMKQIQTDLMMSMLKFKNGVMNLSKEIKTQMTAYPVS